ncbi:hypothetical protein THH46_16095 [Pseudomonas sp. NA13]|uniref:Uncharacterized protein n=1 Tax=Pseudomonas brassicacearum (strain NFM421) TaxID=994484 RepID=F2KJF2_PSEBN|nr:hypothetical protein [Pseudomonas brassicacearum]AEA70178.1 Hypothetical protein PSEBR_m1193 [Pseudomonas brassicacearum subsp. brassicacearum NFM421]QEO79839.1 hypothetical protein ELZ14_20605 [Pseudomonas brassicacearum]
MDDATKAHLQWLDQSAEDHGWNNREEINASEKCICSACGQWSKPAQITKWHDEKHACCPHCGLTGVVVGSESGLPLEEYENSRIPE